jgi:hypothetical protein
MGIHVGVISSRSAIKISEMTSALSNISIIGSSGWESYKKDEHGKVTAHIHEQFYAIKEELTSLLQTVRKTLYQVTESPLQASQDQIESILSTVYGPIVVEKKGVHPDFPEGIIHTYNFNDVDVNKRSEWVKKIASTYQTHIQEIMMRADPSILPTLMQLCALHISAKPQMPGKLSVHISPHISSGKSQAITQYFYAPDDPNRNKLFQGIPGGFDTIIYSGDHDEDGYAFIAGKEAEKTSLSQQKFFSVWVKPGIYQGNEFVVERPQPVAEKNADIILNGVAEYGNLLITIVDLLKS